MTDSIKPHFPAPSILNTRSRSRAQLRYFDFKLYLKSSPDTGVYDCSL